MNALESMTASLRPTGVYALTGRTVIDFELASYAEELNPIYDALTLLERESFAATASDYGLTQYARQFCIPTDGHMEQTRAAVLAMGTVTPENFTKDEMITALKSAGLSCEMTENTAGQSLYLNCPEKIADSDARDAALKTAKLFLPAHLNAELDFRSISWNNIDRADESCDTMDTHEFTWDTVDDYQDAVLRL